ncbi:DUF6286 domain-containing protein [Brachybacterium hainanense]|uniref:DUF6286 domain-containing protein n=1 Tax=Brachybacterium hainanense TaxID=1541174 RepID=A0ABV6REY5_9MICO
MRSSPTPLVHRPARKPAAALLGGAWLVGGLGGAWLLITRMTTGAWPEQAAAPIAALAERSIGSPAVAAASALAAAVGLLLMLLAVLPGPRDGRQMLADEVPGVTAIPHADLARHLRARLVQVDGVHSARVRVVPSRARLDIRTEVEDVDQVRSEVRAAAEAAIAELGPSPAPRLRIRVRGAR